MQEQQTTQALQDQSATQPNKRARAQALQEELAQARQSIEQNLATDLANLCKDTELEDLFYEDKEAFFTKILQIQNEQIRAQIDPKLQELDTLKQEIDYEDKIEAIDQAKKAYEQANPNADTQALLQLFTQLPPEQQAQIEALPPEQIFPTLQNLAQGSGSQNATGQLPQQLSGIPAATSVQEPEIDIPTMRY